MQRTLRAAYRLTTKETVARALLTALALAAQVFRLTEALALCPTAALEEIGGQPVLMEQAAITQPQVPVVLVDTLSLVIHILHILQQEPDSVQSRKGKQMSIPYTYQIINVNEAARCMEVVYSAEGHQTMHIGARLPFEGESLEKVIDMYAPVNYWIEQKRPVVVPQIGAFGLIVPSSSTISITEL
jgi:hypothetical protein